MFLLLIIYNIFETKKRNTYHLSSIKNNFNPSEKIRFYSMLNKLTTIKLIIDSKPKKKFTM